MPDRLCTTPMGDLPVGIIGTGGHGRELAWLARECWGDAASLRFVVEQEHLAEEERNGISVMTLSQFSDRYPGAYVVTAIGDPRLRERCTGKCKAHGLRFASLVHPAVPLSPWVVAEVGCVIAAGSVLTSNIALGRHVHVNVSCSISHDANIGDFSTLSPGVHIAGWVTIGRRVMIGTGAAVRNGAPDRPLLIGDDSVIGAGACVIGDVAAGTTVAGVPATPV